jgi:hypothetical protein
LNSMMEAVYDSRIGKKGKARNEVTICEPSPAIG